jgi:hypothetical protein
MRRVTPQWRCLSCGGEIICNEWGQKVNCGGFCGAIAVMMAPVERRRTHRRGNFVGLAIGFLLHLFDSVPSSPH